MKTLIISNRLNSYSERKDIDLFSWNEANRPSAENYPYVFLDLFFGPPKDDGYVYLTSNNDHFYELGKEIVKCLRAGGIVAALLAPIAVNSRVLDENEDQLFTVRMRRDSLASYADKYKDKHETSYDWLDVGFLKYTHIDALNKKRSSNIKVLANWKECITYFENVSNFWTAIDGDHIRDSPSEVTFTYRIEENNRWGSRVSQHPAWILAIGEHNQDTIAIATNYFNSSGLLVLVPPFDIAEINSSRNLAQTPEIENMLLEFMAGMKEHIRTFEIQDVPEWTKEYRSAKAKKLNAKILGGKAFVAGAFVDDNPDSRFNPDAYRKHIEYITENGGMPVICQSYGLTNQAEADIISSYELLARECNGFIAFELGKMFAPFGRIYSLETYEALMSIPQCRGAKHSSLDRNLEWQRLALRDKKRPEFMVYTGNDLAIDMVIYGSDYLLGLSTFAPDFFAKRDRLWEQGSPDFYRFNDLLQYLGYFSFRSPVPAYKHSAAQFLKLRGWLKSDSPHPKAERRPRSDVAILRDILMRLKELGVEIK